MVLDVYTPPLIMNEARTAAEYRKQKDDEKRKADSEYSDKIYRRYKYDKSHGMDTVNVKNNYWSANDHKNTREVLKNCDADTSQKHLTNYRNSIHDQVQNRGDITMLYNIHCKDRFKNDGEAAEASGAIARHNRRHPDRKLESGIFGVKY
jgi:hypothetical protein